MRTQQEKDEWSKNYEREQKKEFERDKIKLDMDYSSLPDVFKRRIDKFRNNNPDFRWKYEKYEMFVCKQAYILAQTLRTPENVEMWSKKSYEEQMRLVPLFDKNHSGNTAGMATVLAYWYLKEPENVVKLHGALAALVGSEEYGCVPRGGNGETLNTDLYGFLFEEE